MSRNDSRVAVALLIALASGSAVLAQQAEDAARYIDGLSKRGYLTDVNVSGDRITAAVGPKMQYIRARSSRLEICAQLLAFARATNREVIKAALVDASGQRLIACP